MGQRAEPQAGDERKEGGEDKSGPIVYQPLRRRHQQHGSGENLKQLRTAVVHPGRANDEKGAETAVES